MPPFKQFDRRTFATDIVGFSHSGYKFTKNDKDKALELIPENNNQFDPNAVRVHLDGKKIGYVSRCSAPQVRKMVQNREVRLWVIEQKFDFGLRVQIRMSRRLNR